MNEGILIAKAKRGNEKAFKKLFETFSPPLYRFLRQFSRDTDRVEDWVQQSFIKAFYKIESFEGRSRFSTWLFKIGINEMRNDLTRKQIFSELELEALEIESDSNIEEEFEWKTEMKDLMNLLDEEKRSVFILFEVEGYSHREISEIMNISEMKSRTTLSRTKSILKTKLQMAEG